MRCDIVVFNKDFKPSIIIECKAPNIKITEKTFNQAIDYYYVLKPKHLIVTNGLNHFYIEFNNTNNTYKFIKDIPDYSIK